MPAVVEARTMLCAVPLDVSRGESKGVWLQRASRLLGLAPAKGKRIYYGELKRIDADTFAAMRKRALAIESLNQRISSAQAAENRHRKESHEIKESLGVLRVGRGPNGRSGELDVGAVQPLGPVVPGPSE